MAAPGAAWAHRRTARKCRFPVSHILQASPGRRAGFPWRGPRRSFAGRNSRVKPLVRDRPDTRMTPGAAHPASAAAKDPERAPAPAQARKGQARASRPARSAGEPPRRGTRRGRARGSVSTTRIPAAGWTPGARARATPGDGGPRPGDARERRTNRDRSPVAPALVQFRQNLVQRCNGRRRRRRPRSDKRRGRQHAGPHRVGQEGVGEDRAPSSPAVDRAPPPPGHGPSPGSSRRTPRAGHIRSACCSAP